ncbi:hypothetical protein CEUSTIGMA_g2548.t1 [Chlamydomonas eustigma]|uniref:RING-type domain-containing protein n=1 Tax=Chlamydomonas eustigma TaxID=1157962 RepID=A0A250WW91_9CHLO|nr:hypothetical protein CEUSTIGMA_g2548.t1 [Chlamydomonas eustigma]|eukprot:GAX75104.1 hypothetical protein CEUSTIGMA_g2548.t1 [Chlamydomonas eustigma]
MAQTIAESEDCGDFDADGARTMTRKVVQQLLRGASGTYVTPQFNTTLYLNNQGFRSIQGLEDYTGCKVLHLERNCLSVVQGLSHMIQLRALYLQSNNISVIEGLEACTQLQHLDISNNPISLLSGLPPSLNTLHASSIGLDKDTSILLLSEMCPELQVLDISKNRLPLAAAPALSKLLKLRVLYTKENPCTRSPNYRRVLISTLANLSYLDEQPIDELERCGAEAWAVGGRVAEQAAKEAWREERRRAVKRTMATFAVERAQRRVLRELSGLIGNDEQLSWLMGMLEGPLHADSVPTLVSRMIGGMDRATASPEALYALETGLYSREMSRRGTEVQTFMGERDGVEDSSGPCIAAQASQLEAGWLGAEGLVPELYKLVKDGSADAGCAGAEECVVCSEELQEGAEVMWLPCSHVFHERCIRRWLTGFSNSCPTCRASVINPQPSHIPSSATTVHAILADPMHQTLSDAHDSEEPAGEGQQEVCQHGSGVGIRSNLMPPPPLLSLEDPDSDSGGHAPGPGASNIPSPSTVSTNRIVSNILMELCAALSISPRDSNLAIPVPNLPSVLPESTSPLSASTSSTHQNEARIKGDALTRASEKAKSETYNSTVRIPSYKTVLASTDSHQVESASGQNSNRALSTASEEHSLDQGRSSANTLEDPTYCHLQNMFRRNFGQKSKAAESVLGGWRAFKEGRRRQQQLLEDHRDLSSAAAEELETAGRSNASSGSIGVDSFARDVAVARQISYPYLSSSKEGGNATHQQHPQAATSTQRPSKEARGSSPLNNDSDDSTSSDEDVETSNMTSSTTRFSIHSNHDVIKQASGPAGTVPYQVPAGVLPSASSSSTSVDITEEASGHNSSSSSLQEVLRAVSQVMSERRGQLAANLGLPVADEKKLQPMRHYDLGRVMQWSLGLSATPSLSLPASYHQKGVPKQAPVNITQAVATPPALPRIAFPVETTAAGYEDSKRSRGVLSGLASAATATGQDRAQLVPLLTCGKEENLDEDFAVDLWEVSCVKPSSMPYL